MINKTKKIKTSNIKTKHSQLFMLASNSLRPNMYFFSKSEIKYKFPRFSISKIKNSKSSNLSMCLLGKETVRGYQIFNEYNRFKNIFSSKALTNRVMLLNSLRKNGFYFRGSQINKNKGGSLMASLGFIFFVPRRQRIINSRGKHRIIGFKLVLRRYRKFSYLYKIKVNLVSSFRLNVIQQETTPPKLETRKPRLGIKPPKLGTRKPKLGIKPPKLGTRKPKLGIKNPKLETKKPKLETRKPKLGIKPPKLGIKPPKLGTRKPKLGIKTPKLEIKTPKLGIKPPKLETKKPKLGIKNPKLGIKNPKLGIKNPKLGIKNPKLETKKPKLGIKNPKLGTTPPQIGNKKPKIGNKPFQTGNNKSKIGNNPSQTGNNKPKIGNKKKK